MTTHVNLSTFPIEDIETAIKLARRNYFSSCYAMTKNDLMKVIGRIMLNDWHLIVDPKTFVNNEPMYGEEIEKLLKEYFRFYYTKELVYLAPKRTRKRDVLEWLGGGNEGTMENPLYW